MGEVACLDLGDVDLQIGTIAIRETKFFKSRILPLTETALREYLDDLQGKFAFVDKTKNGQPRPIYLPLTVGSALANLEVSPSKVFRYTKCGRIYNLLDEAARGAGVTIPDGIAVHIFRHSYAALMRRKAGLDTSGLLPAPGNRPMPLVCTSMWSSAKRPRRPKCSTLGNVRKA